MSEQPEGGSRGLHVVRKSSAAAAASAADARAGLQVQISSGVSSSTPGGGGGGGLSAGVRGLSGAITVERTEDEKLKYPDRINLDRKGLHGIPILEDEPALRLLSLQHNFIKRIQHLDTTYRLVFLDLYHNRLDLISNLEPLVNLRVLMLGKNRIRRVEGLQRCNRLSVLDLHGNRITQITGLDNLSELKVLNLAGNLIRKVSNLSGLTSLEELNVRRNRIRVTQGLEVVPTLEKLYMSNNEIQAVSSLQKMEALVHVHTIQMEGNPVWSSSEYSFHLVSALPKLKILDQQEISSEVRLGASRWKQQQLSAATATAATASSSSPSASRTGARTQLLKKMEERNVSITNAKTRWTFLQKQSFKQEEENIKDDGAEGEDSSATRPIQVKQPQSRAGSLLARLRRPVPSSPLPSDQGEERDGSDTDIDDDPSTASKGKVGTPESTLSEVKFPSSVSSPQLAPPASGAGTPLSLSRQASRNNLLSKLNVPGLFSTAPDKSKSTPGSPSSCKSVSTRSGGSEAEGKMFPPIPVRSEHIKRRFPGIERRKFALPQKYVSLNTSSSGHDIDHVTGFSNSSPLPKAGNGGNTNFASVEKKIGFFHTPSAADEGQSTSDEFSGAGLLSDSSDDSSSSDNDDTATPHTPFISAHHTRRGEAIRRNTSTPKLLKVDSSLQQQQQQQQQSQPGTSGSSSRGLNSRSGTPLRHVASSGLLGGPSPSSAAMPLHSETGRTSEQGRDYLIELDGDLLSVYGLQSLKFLDRPWNRHRALKATTVQFNFVSFDDLVPYLAKFRQTFPNVDNFEFLETDIHSLGQLNALAGVQGWVYKNIISYSNTSEAAHTLVIKIGGIQSLFIGDDGNPIFHKNWKSYAIYRLEHWGLQYVNNAEVTDEAILEANQAYGSLGELAILVLPYSQIMAIIKKFDLMGSCREPPSNPSDSSSSQPSASDLLSSIRDPHVKEIIAKESLQYRPQPHPDPEAEARNLAALESMVELGHAAFHKFGRLEDEWVFILPILVKRIVAQYSDLGQYKKESLVRLEKKMMTAN